MLGNVIKDDDTLDGNNSLDDGHETDMDCNVRLGSFALSIGALAHHLAARGHHHNLSNSSEETLGYL